MENVANCTTCTTLALIKYVLIRFVLLSNQIGYLSDRRGVTGRRSLYWIDGLAMGFMYGVTTGCHTSCYSMH